MLHDFRVFRYKLASFFHVNGVANRIVYFLV